MIPALKIGANIRDQLILIGGLALLLGGVWLIRHWQQRRASRWDEEE